MNKTIESCIRQLSADDALKGKTLGMLIPNILFQDIECALVLDAKDKTYYILGEETKIEETRKRVTCMLAELINALDYLYSEHLIYYIGTNLDELQIVSTFAEKIQTTATPNEFRCGNNRVLCKQDGCYVLRHEGTIEYISIEADTVLFRKLYELMSSCIFPTTQLSEYIDRGFCTEDRYIAKKSLDSSKCSLTLAFLVAILSPFAALLLGNLWGVTKLDNEQFNSLKEQTYIYDTISFHDTIIEQQIDTLYIEKQDAKQVKTTKK